MSYGYIVLDMSAWSESLLEKLLRGTPAFAKFCTYDIIENSETFSDHLAHITVIF